MANDSELENDTKLEDDPKLENDPKEKSLIVTQLGKIVFIFNYKIFIKK